MSRERYSATNHFAETLRRRERSAAWLARRIGVSQQLISFVIQGQRTLAADKAHRAAAVLDEPVAYLFTVSTPVTQSATHVAREAAAA